MAWNMIPTDFQILLWLYIGGVAFAYACGRVDGAKAACRAPDREDLAEKLP